MPRKRDLSYYGLITFLRILFLYSACLGYLLDLLSYRGMIMLMAAWLYLGMVARDEWRRIK